jgi:hypothetical protein
METKKEKTVQERSIEQAKKASETAKKKAEFPPIVKKKDTEKEK